MHGHAAFWHSKKGNTKMEAHHKGMSEYHAGTAKRIKDASARKENADAPEVIAPVVIENADVRPDALAEALARIAALEAKQVELTTKIENADAAPVRNRPVLPGSVVLRDPVIENADTSLDAEVERLAKMPTDQARHELIRRALTHSAIQ